MKPSALIGFSGFVGSNILRQHQFETVFNSKNIDEIKDGTYDLVVCAGASAEKWKANREPENDLHNIKSLIRNLTQIMANEFILISTVDVYSNPQAVYEDSAIIPEQNSAYGNHRFQLEEFVRNSFSNHLIIRLPGLIGKGLKKNFIFDMLHKPEALSLTNANSKYQFYSLDFLWADIQKIRNKGISTINFAIPPLSVETIALKCFGKYFTNEISTHPVNYDMRTHYADYLGHTGNYIWTEEKELEEIRLFVESQRIL